MDRLCHCRPSHLTEIVQGIADIGQLAHCDAVLSVTWDLPSRENTFSVLCARLKRQIRRQNISAIP
ncbi:pyridoxamine kinase [Salmonella enterica subsp. enterica]|uniref:Pyridoxamine kinase n=1 Tax=Salmonella enterica I TaxID=59201 RepID=A0A379WW92_SALET|nr:pyridoxamine kinase [Salmonella enterica subsp. enterica]